MTKSVAKHIHFLVVNVFYGFGGDTACFYGLGGDTFNIKGAIEQAAKRAKN